MHSDNLRVGIVQYDITDDLSKNISSIERLIGQLAENKPDLIVLPEVCLTGFGRGKEAPAFQENDSTLSNFSNFSKVAGCPILAGIRIEENGERYNRALLFTPGGIAERYDKRILFSYWNEHKLFGTGTKSLSFRLGKFDIAPLICYELRFPELFRQQIGTELFIVIANWPVERREHWKTLLRARAIENQAFVIGVNRIGSVKEVDFVGDSLAFDPLGSCLLELGNQELAVTVDLDINLLREYRKKFPVLDDALL